MKFQVSLTPTARWNVQSIIEWIAQRSRTGAESWHRRWLEVLRFLGDSAEACSLAPEDSDHEVELRDFNFKTPRGRPYRVIFTIQQQKVVVLYVRGPGQDLIAPDDIDVPNL